MTRKRLEASGDGVPWSNLHLPFRGNLSVLIHAAAIPIAFATPWESCLPSVGTRA